MPMPPSVTRIKKGNVEFIDNCDRVNYTLHELTRAALRDTGKYICHMFRRNYYSSFRRKKGNVGRYTQYWVRKKETDLQVGIKPNAFYGGFQELGSSKTSKLGLLKETVQKNIPQIIKIQSQYLSGLESEAKALSMISEKEFKGGADE